MKTIALKTTIIFLLVLLPASLYAQGYVWHTVTPEDAAKAVREFKAKPELALKVMFPTTEPPQADPISESHAKNAVARIIPHTDSLPSENDLLCSYSINDGRYQYSVNYYSLDEFGFLDTFIAYPDKFYGQHYDPIAFKSMVMSETSAQAIAQDYMRCHYPEPALLNKLTVTPNYGSQGDEPADQRFIHSYQFSFDQDCGGGVMAPAGCFIEVDTIKGQIIIFTYGHYPVLISPIPKLTGQEAISAAMNALNITDGVPGAVDRVGISKPDGMGEEGLYYGVTFYGVRNGEKGNYYATVNGNTGELTRWDISHSIAIKPKTPVSSVFSLLRVQMAKKPKSVGQPLKLMRETTPINLNCPLLGVVGKAFMYAGYLTYNSPGGKMTAGRDKRITISGPTRRTTFNITSRDYSFNGKTKQMSTKPILINDRCYVPLDVMQTVLGGKWNYDAKAKTVRYDPPQKKVARK